MPDIETVDILTINYNTIDMQTSSEKINRKQKDVLGCTNKIKNAQVAMQCKANTDGTVNDYRKSNGH